VRWTICGTRRDEECNMNKHGEPGELEVSKSSGNVFEDLGIENPAEELAKAKLASGIRQAIRDIGLTQVEAAQRLGTDQADISRIMGGKVSRFTIDRLIRFICALDRQVDIVISNSPDETGRLAVTAP
jgi:predicted XRE-type DNA-binding protein